jgi:hypothetical protein
MYSAKLKELSTELEHVSIPEEFKFGEFENGFDMMELYEELFDYSYEIKNDRPLKSNFSMFLNNKDIVIEQLEISKAKNKLIYDICDVCDRFCREIYTIVS